MEDKIYELWDIYKSKVYPDGITNEDQFLQVQDAFMGGLSCFLVFLSSEDVEDKNWLIKFRDQLTNYWNKITEKSCIDKNEIN